MKKRSVIPINFDEVTKEKLKAEAKSQMRSLASYIRWLIRSHPSRKGK